MAKITNYTAPSQSPETSFQRATPESMGADVGKGLEAVGKGVQHFYAQMEEDEARQALVASAQIRAKYAQALDDATVSGADTAPLKEKMTDEFSKISENLNTKRGLQSLALHQAQSNLMFDDQANRIAVTRARDQATLQAKTFMDSIAKTLAGNPSYLPIAERDIDSFASTLPPLSPDHRAIIINGMKEQANMTAVMASTRIDAPGTKAKLEAGEWTLTPAQREQGIHQADARIREIRADERAARQDAEYQAHKASEAASDVVLRNLFAGQLKDADIFNNADILPNKKEDLLHFKEWYTAELVNKENKPHPKELMDLWLKIHAPSDDPRKIYNADEIFRYAEGSRLNAKEAELASSWVANQKDENNVKFMTKLQGKMSLIRAGMTADPKWAAQGELSSAVQLEIMNRADARSKELRRANEDPSSIFDPDSKNFMFRPGLLTSVANDIRAQHREMTMLRFDNPEDPALKALPAGTHFLDANGVERIVPKAAVAPAKQATSLDIQAGYIESIPRSSRVRINAPARSLARQLNGQTYESREAAMEALKGLTERRQ